MLKPEQIAAETNTMISGSQYHDFGETNTMISGGQYHDFGGQYHDFSDLGPFNPLNAKRIPSPSRLLKLSGQGRILCDGFCW